MRVGKEQIFNLMDTNGRRQDVTDAVRGYLEILDDLLSEQKLAWDSLPGSTAQFEFYCQAVAQSPDVFRKHEKYDALMAQLDEMPALKKALAERDMDWLAKRFRTEVPEEWSDELDESIEARARHYTNTLVKLGFTDEQRRITAAGDLLLGHIPLRRDKLEALLPLRDANIIYLRQLLKLRIFDAKGKRCYAPFLMALYMLLRQERVSQAVFFSIVQGLNPYRSVEDFDALIDGCEESGGIPDNSLPVPPELNRPVELRESDFSRFFENRKSGKTVSVYYRFYQALVDFNRTESAENLDRLLTLYEDNRDMLNKAFGSGRALFQNRRGNRPSVRDFLKQEQSGLLCASGLLRGGLPENGSIGEDFQRFNEMFYRRFRQSKTMDAVREYSDTTRRIFKASGLISFENGYVELVCRDLCLLLFDPEAVRASILGDLSKEYADDKQAARVEPDDEYHFHVFFQNHAVSAILHYTDERLDAILHAVQTEFGGAPLDEISRLVQRRRKQDFERMIADRYPEKHVKYLLGLFSDRSNDGIIRKAVCPDASVPTIYEYVVGLAWYYFSNKTMDLLESLNLTLSADFEPLTHAGGGMGDIVIYAPDKVILLEATLMNANSQKRGEWEPVLRHSVNLKTEVEQSGPREVTTFFIADSFDSNTINIWKAVSSVPLQSSTDKSRYTDSVIIMPLSSRELARLMDRSNEYHQIIRQVRDLFLKDMRSFNRNWREEFISRL